MHPPPRARTNLSHQQEINGEELAALGSAAMECLLPAVVDSVLDSMTSMLPHAAASAPYPVTAEALHNEIFKPVLMIACRYPGWAVCLRWTAVMHVHIRPATAGHHRLYLTRPYANCHSLILVRSPISLPFSLQGLREGRSHTRLSSARQVPCQLRCIRTREGGGRSSAAVLLCSACGHLPYR